MREARFTQCNKSQVISNKYHVTGDMLLVMCRKTEAI